MRRQRRPQHEHSYVVGVLTLLEYAIVTGDAAGYLVYLVNTGYQAWKEL